MKNILATIWDTVSRRQQVAGYLYSHACYDEHSHVTYKSNPYKCGLICSVTMRIVYQLHKMFIYLYKKIYIHKHTHAHENVEQTVSTGGVITS